MPDAVPFASVTAADVAAEFEEEAAPGAEVAAGGARGSGATAGATSAARAYWELARRNFKKVRRRAHCAADGATRAGARGAGAVRASPRAE